MKRLVCVVMVLGLIVCVGSILYAGNFPTPGSAPVKVTSDPCCYHFVGYSSASTNGGPPNGIASMNQLCQDTFGSPARMCTSSEFMNSPQTPTNPTVPPNPVFGWVQPVTTAFTFVPATAPPQLYCLDITGVAVSSSVFGGYCQLITSCDGWASPNGALQGLSTLSSARYISGVGCANLIPVTCCAP